MQQTASQTNHLRQAGKMDMASGIVCEQLFMETETDEGSHCIVSKCLLGSQLSIRELEGLSNVQQGLSRNVRPSDDLLFAKEEVDE